MNRDISDLATKAQPGAPDSAQWVAAADMLLRGEVIAMPTDTVYGLAAHVDQPAAIARIYDLKRRPATKAIPVLLSESSKLSLITSDLSAPAIALARAFWPGGLTMVVTALSHLPSPLTSAGDAQKRTVAVRIPDHPLARQIIAAAGGALAVTSANLSGQAPATNAAQIDPDIARGIGLVVDGGPAPGGVPSTIVSVTGATVRILREGAVPIADIRAVLEHCDASQGAIHVVTV